MQSANDVEQLAADLHALADSFSELTEQYYLKMADFYTTINMQSQ